ncbi:class I SAM-dependent methyltransferase [Paenibacillus chibensis]|uniref:class I SAM-dependent methyltransferase n=1 Tax=Paenibacillus chibensis TaxID=59846 RepID=UPI000FDAB483|nr:class I SAM-dependent methyltransferase [Paenibacillus chibensis]MEC0368611.1 class I SAM-dependent methyltransferase [Paenibacillus chibensis]
MEKNSNIDFYDGLATSYHLIFHDWERLVTWQGEFFNQFIRARLPHAEGSAIKLLDASCGIGTQALGLAQHDFLVTATDLSPKSVERAAREAERLGVQLHWGIADFRTLGQDVPGRFEVVLSADNAIPHLLTDEDLHQACRQLYSKLEDNGLLILSIRDYDQEIIMKQCATEPRVMDGGKRIAFQVWDWHEGGHIYTTNQFILQETNGHWETHVSKTDYRALLRAELSEALNGAEFKNIQWHMPSESGYYQPIVTAGKLGEQE